MQHMGIGEPWDLNRRAPYGLKIWQPYRGRTDQDWYRGTSDAIYQNRNFITEDGSDTLLILAGDHIYKQDYRDLLRFHQDKGADLTVAVMNVPQEEVSRFGIMSVDPGQKISRFVEKPKQSESTLASMGVYVFDAQYLYETLMEDAEIAESSHDFGKDVIPRLIERGEDIYAHDFYGSCVNMTNGVPYWRDVGTVDAYYDANIDLTRVIPELNLYDTDWPVWTYQEQMPPAKFVFDDPDRRGAAIDSIVSGGCIVSGSTVKRSLLFTNVRVHNHCRIEDSVILSNCEIGPDAIVRNAVIDKYCRIPQGMRIGVDLEEDRRRFHVTEKGRLLVVPEMLGQAVHHTR